ncbi:restriction endonuclease subunit S [Melioribacter sp. Ez-97]|uniref:restriction endonuclease subunit S n=1 Tax=Melioribacter sp. Ez-97 TaxID=3423434 RepID=UPI003ED8754F
MNNWKECKLGDVISSNNRSISSDYPYRKILYLDTGSITEGKIDGFQNYLLEDAPSRAKRLVKQNDIIYSTVRPIQKHFGFIENPPENLVVSTGFSVIETNNELADPKFVYYFLTSSDVVELLDVIAEGSTSAYPSIKPSDIENLDILLPPLPEQKAIAGVLSSLDDKIDLLHRQNKTLEEMAETLFMQWFVEEADEKWEEKPLDKIADYLNGLACQKYPPKNEIDKLPVLKIKELRNGFTENSDWASTEIPAEYIIENGDVIFSWSGSLMVKIWDGEKCILNQHLFKVTSKEYPKWFYYFWTKYHLEKFISIAESKSTTMGHIKREDLSNSMVIVPDEDKLKEMDNIISPYIEKLIINNKQIRTLEKLRNTLLPRLMSGEVRVKY